MLRFSQSYLMRCAQRNAAIQTRTYCAATQKKGMFTQFAEARGIKSVSQHLKEALPAREAAQAKTWVGKHKIQNQAKEGGAVTLSLARFLIAGSLIFITYHGYGGIKYLMTPSEE
mmetsp:Transcript_20171/g.22436  ORF Transcript_20171/g.22436 Transcript_20171/m.22436 type:complete len:115 (+) Transcript_20171:73-417(+)